MATKRKRIEPPPLRLGAGQHAIDPADYHKDPCEEASLSASLAATLLEASPLHAWLSSPRLNPNFTPRARKEFELGEAAHGYLTGKGRALHVVNADSYATKAAQQERDRARAAGKTPLTRPQAANLRGLLGAYRAQMEAHGLGDVFLEAAPAELEATLLWQQDGIWNRCLADCIKPAQRVIYDYKTTGGYAQPDAWLRRTADLGQEIRARHYLDGAEAVHGGAWRYRFVVQEIADPWALAIIELDGISLELGARMIGRARGMWRACLDEQFWPGYGNLITRCRVPTWREKQWVEREAAEQAYMERTGRDVLEDALRWQRPQQIEAQQ